MSSSKGGSGAVSSSKGGSGSLSGFPARLAAETKDRRTGADQSPNRKGRAISIIDYSTGISDNG